MSEGSPIGWLHQPGYKPMTLNFVLGCVHRSDGCDNCFAPRWVARQAHLPGRDGIVVKTPLGLDWTGVVKTYPERLPKLRTLTKPHMVFVTALGELFDPQVSMDNLILLWETMAATPHHIYVILTKLAKRMHDIVAKLAARFGVLPNVWIGVSAENQHQADARIPWLIRADIAVRVVSCEPMITPIDLRTIPYRGDTDYLIDPLHRRYRTHGPATDGWGTTPFGSGMANLGGIDWVIVGGESGPKDKIRAMHPVWARDLVAQAVRAKVAVFFKQWGGWAPAPWVVRVCDPEQGWTGTEAELAAAKKDAEAKGATHALPVWADQYDMRPYDVGHKCWSLERRELPIDSPHAALRYHQGTGGGHVLDDRTWQQWPLPDGGILDVSTTELVNAE